MKIQDTTYERDIATVSDHFAPYAATDNGLSIIVGEK